MPIVGQSDGAAKTNSIKKFSKGAYLNTFIVQGTKGYEALLRSAMCHVLKSTLVLNLGRSQLEQSLV